MFKRLFILLFSFLMLPFLTISIVRTAKHLEPISVRGFMNYASDTLTSTRIDKVFQIDILINALDDLKWEYESLSGDESFWTNTGTFFKNVGGFFLNVSNAILTFFVYIDYVLAIIFSFGTWFIKLARYCLT